MENIMDILTPKPPFDPKKKNKVFAVGKPVPVDSIHATSLKLK